MNKLPLITPAWHDQGVELRELDDHILELYKDGIPIARFSTQGVTLLSLTQEVNHDNRKRNPNPRGHH